MKSVLSKITSKEAGRILAFTERPLRPQKALRGRYASTITTDDQSVFVAIIALRDRFFAGNWPAPCNPHLYANVAPYPTADALLARNQTIRSGSRPHRFPIKRPLRLTSRTRHGLGTTPDFLRRVSYQRPAELPYD